LSKGVDVKRSVLLLFDFLEGHVNRDDEAKKRYGPIMSNAALLLAAARTAGMLVAYANANHGPQGSTAVPTIRDTDNRLRPIEAADTQSHWPLISADTPEARVIAELAPRNGDLIVLKRRWSAFHGTGLEAALRARGIDTIILCGGSTDVGIAATAFAARDLDYNLVIASDACTSPEQDNHDQLMRRVFPRMSRVRTTSEIVEMLGT
jgi:ureidoacrylate peracid hydrolase